MDRNKNPPQENQSDVPSLSGDSPNVEPCADLVAQLDQSAQAAADFLKALASPNRLKILCCLIKGEKSVGSIAAQVGIREAAASQHLSLLRKDHLVSARRVGQTVYYRLDSPVAQEIIAVLYAHFCPQAAADSEAVDVHSEDAG